MAKYVDGYVLPLPRKNLAAYRKLSRLAGRIWREHGALEYCETFGDELDIQGVFPFSRLARLKPGETAVFSWIVFKSKADRNRVNKSAMADPRLAKMMQGPSPFDCKRMSFGGFKMFVQM